MIIVLGTSFLCQFSPTYETWQASKQILLLLLLTGLSGSIFLCKTVFTTKTLSFTTLDILLFTYTLIPLLWRTIVPGTDVWDEKGWLPVANFSFYLISKDIFQKKRLRHLLPSWFTGLGLGTATYCFIHVILLLPTEETNQQIWLLQHSAFLGGLCSILFVFAFALATHTANAWKTRSTSRTQFIYAAFTIFSIGAVLLMTKSRAALLAAIVGIFVLLLSKVGFQHQKVSFWKWKWVVAVIILVSLSSYSLFFWKPDSALGRLFVWKISLQIVRDYPLFGIGYGNFGAIYGHYQAAYFATGNFSMQEVRIAGPTRLVFNEPLRILIEEGLINLCLWVLIILIALKTLWQDLPDQFPSKTVLAGLVTFLAFSLFSYPSQIIPLSFLGYMFLAIASAGSQRVSFKKMYCLPQYFKQFVSLLIFSGILLISKPFYYRWQAYTIWQDAHERLFSSQGSSLDDYHLAEPALAKHGPFLLDWGITSASAGKCAAAVPALKRALPLFADANGYIWLGQCLQANGRLKEAAKAYIKAHHVVPHRLIPLYSLMELYRQEGDTTAVISIAKKIQNWPIKINSSTASAIKAVAEDIVRQK